MLQIQVFQEVPLLTEDQNKSGNWDNKTEYKTYFLNYVNMVQLQVKK